MTGGNILRGYFVYLRNCPIPFWVVSPEHALPIERAYIREPYGGEGGLLAFLQPFPHNHASNIHGDRAFIRRSNNEIFTAFLTPDNHILDEYMEPRLYVRMPNHNFTLYSAPLQHIDGHRPNWL